MHNALLLTFISLRFLFCLFLSGYLHRFYCIKNIIRVLLQLSEALLALDKEQEFCGKGCHIYLVQNHMSFKCRSRSSGHSACLKSILWTITMQGSTLAAIKMHLY